MFAANRRRFLARLVAAFGAFASASGVASIIAACTREKASGRRFDVSSLKDDGNGIITDVTGSDGARIMIVRRSASDFVALSTQCTHEGCPVNAAEHGTITCPCHGSQYDLSGAVIRGPSQFPLLSYPTALIARTREVEVTIT